MSYYKISYEILYSSTEAHYVPCEDEPDYDPINNRWHFTWGCGYRHPRDAGIEFDEAMEAKWNILSARDNISLRESVLCEEIFEELDGTYEIVACGVTLTEYQFGKIHKSRFRAKDLAKLDALQGAVYDWHVSGNPEKLRVFCEEHTQM